MRYYLSKAVSGSFEEALDSVREALKVEGFGVITEIGFKASLKKKLDIDFRDYVILGACNPVSAHRAVLAEPNVGLLLPCNVLVQQTPVGAVEVAVIDPVAAMQAASNPQLAELAAEVGVRLQRVLASL
jgi:uncharacterized protein (DUF302 family)